MCQGYHWSLEEALNLTIPQIIMLNHAAWKSSKKYKQEADTTKPEVEISQMDSKQMADYYSRWD